MAAPTHPHGHHGASPRLAMALKLAAMGLRIFPLWPNSKQAFVGDWPRAATRDAGKLMAWWSTKDFNIGVACGKEEGDAGKYLVGLDYDQKRPEQQGLAAFAAHRDAGWLNTLLVRTPTGGAHAYLWSDVYVASRMGKLAPNVDVKCWRGYLVGPASVINGAAYAILDAVPIATVAGPLAEQLAALSVTTAPPRPERDGEITSIPVEFIDTTMARDRAIEWLVNEAAEARQGSGGDAVTLAVAMAVRDIGISEAMCLELMAGWWNQQKAYPPWSLDDSGDSLQQKVRNAYAYAKRPLGGKSVEADFADTPEMIAGVKAEKERKAREEAGEKTGGPQAGASSQPRYKLATMNMTDWDDEDIPILEWAIPNVAPLRSVGLHTGEGGGGKSIIELMKDVCHVMGLEWFGMHPVQRPVLYLGTEDSDTVLKIRLMLIARHYGVKFKDLIANGLHIWPLAECTDPLLVAVNAKTGTVETTPRYDVLKEFCSDVKPINVSVDMLTQVFSGNENIRAEVSAFARHMRVLAHVANGSVTALAHPSLTGIASGSGLSGSTAWHGAFRFRQYLTPVRSPGEDEDAPDNGLRKLRFLKNQYGPRGATITLKWSNGLFLPVAGSSDADRMARQDRADSLFLAVLVRLEGQKRWVSNKKRAENYAPAVFAAEAEMRAEKVQKEELEEAMRRLFRTEEIILMPYGRPSRPNERISSKTSTKSSALD